MWINSRRGRIGSVRFTRTGTCRLIGLSHTSYVSCCYVCISQPLFIRVMSSLLYFCLYPSLYPSIFVSDRVPSYLSVCLSLVCPYTHPPPIYPCPLIYICLSVIQISYPHYPLTALLHSLICSSPFFLLGLRSSKTGSGSS